MKIIDAYYLVIIIGFIIWFGFFPKYTSIYRKGVEDTQKEAFEKGLMTKEITSDDKVVYRWININQKPTL